MRQRPVASLANWQRGSSRVCQPSLASLPNWQRGRPEICQSRPGKSGKLAKRPCVSLPASPRQAKEAPMSLPAHSRQARQAGKLAPAEFASRFWQTPPGPSCQLAGLARPSRQLLPGPSCQLCQTSICISMLEWAISRPVDGHQSMSL